MAVRQPLSYRPKSCDHFIIGEWVPFRLGVIGGLDRVSVTRLGYFERHW